MSICDKSYSFVQKQLKTILQRIEDAEKRYNRIPRSVKLVAVSKLQPVAKIQTAIASGQFAFGENYLQEALAKIQKINNSELEWHFIGAIQANKTRLIAENFSWAHSVCNKKVAQRLNDHRPSSLPPLNVCIQVKTSVELSKSGLADDEETFELAQFIMTLPHLQLRGLMTVPQSAQSFEEQRKPFQQLAQLLKKLNAQGHHLDTLSMGMSNDLEAAIAEGATLVRVGTDIFGPRAP